LTYSICRFKYEKTCFKNISIYCLIALIIENICFEIYQQNQKQFGHNHFLDFCHVYIITLISLKLKIHFSLIVECLKIFFDAQLYFYKIFFIYIFKLIYSKIMMLLKNQNQKTLFRSLLKQLRQGLKQEKNI
jgi:hypothetical protein